MIRETDLVCGLPFVPSAINAMGCDVGMTNLASLSQHCNVDPAGWPTSLLPALKSLENCKGQSPSLAKLPAGF